MRWCKSLAALGLAWGAALWVGCGDLETIELDRCGNDVIERTEDCDGFVPDKQLHLCIGPGVPGQCRFGCGPRPDDSIAECPPGYGCGKDAICRQHSGSPGVKLSTGTPSGRWLEAGDFDGDGDDDIINVSETHLSVDYLEDGVFRQTLRIPIEATGLPSVANVNGDSRADVLVPTALGLAVFRSAPGRELAPTTYASLSVFVDRFIFVPLDIVPDVVALDGELVRFAGDEELLLTKGGSFVIQSAREVERGASITGAMKFDLGGIVAQPIVARFDDVVDVHGAYTESPEQFALATSDEVIIIRPSHFEKGAVRAYFLDAQNENGPGNPLVPASHPGATRVRLDGGLEISRIYAVQLNGEGATPGESRIPCGAGYAIADQHLDLLVVASETAAFVAYGVGDATFHSDPCELGEVAAMTVAADNSLEPSQPLSACDEVLAAGDIDGDGAVDFVTTTGVWLSGLIPAGQEAQKLCSAFTRVPVPDGGRWSVAEVGDFNGDGRPDVFAGDEKSNGVDFFATMPGSILNHVRMATLAGAFSMAKGDFDGNGIVDLALTEVLAEHQAVSVIFGEPGALPTEPVEIAALPAINGLASVSIALPGEFVVDAADDLHISTAKNEDDDSSSFRLATLYGRPDRQLQAPFTFSVEASAATGVTARYVPVGAVVASFDFGCDDAQGGRALMMTGRRLGDDPPKAPAAIVGAACLGEAGALTPLGATESAVTQADGTKLEESIVAAMELVPGGGAEPVVISWKRDLTARRIEIMAPVPEGAGASFAWPRASAATLVGALPLGTRAVDPNATAPSSVLRRWSENLTSPPEACRLGTGEAQSLVFVAVHDAETCGGLDDAATFDRPARSVLHILPAKTLLDTRSGGGLAGARQVSTEDDRTIVGFACTNVDSDAAQEIAVLVVVGLLDACAGAASNLTAEILIVDSDEEGNFVLRTEAAYATLTDDDVFSLDGVDNRAPPVFGLAGGDFNGDGVGDLTVGTLTDTFVWLGKPANE